MFIFPPFVPMLHSLCPSSTMIWNIVFIIPNDQDTTHNHAKLQCPIDDLFQFINHVIIQQFVLQCIIRICTVFGVKKNILEISLFLSFLSWWTHERIFQTDWNHLFSWLKIFRFNLIQLNSIKFMAASNMHHLNDD